MNPQHRFFFPQHTVGVIIVAMASSPNDIRLTDVDPASLPLLRANCLDPRMDGSSVVKQLTRVYSIRGTYGFTETYALEKQRFSSQSSNWHNRKSAISNWLSFWIFSHLIIALSKEVIRSNDGVIAWMA